MSDDREKELYNFISKVFDNALEVFFCHDEEGNIMMSNALAKSELGYEGSMRGIHISSIFPNVLSSDDSELEPELIYDGQSHQMMAYRKNTTCFRAEVRAMFLGMEASPYIIMLRNISDKYSLEKNVEAVKQEAEDAAKVKSEFVANITHELRTPVNGILGNTRILLEEIEDPKAHKILETIEHGCNDMNNLINSILDFSKLEAGKFTLESREFEFKNMIEYVKSNHTPKLTEKGLDFFVTVSPGVPKVIVADELRIGQILNNLLSNAAKFTHVGKVSLEVLKTAQDKNRVELFFIVSDTGIGIAKEDLDKLFKSFSQVDASVSRRYGGTGLGLNISKQLVNLMGGNISVDSEVNKGTMFSFSIWVEIPDNEVEDTNSVIDTYKPTSINEINGDDQKMVFGTSENTKEIQDTMSKLILCIEMDNWEKAENFMESVKQLTAEGPREIKTAILKLKMAVQKEDYDKAIDAHENFMNVFNG